MPGNEESDKSHREVAKAGPVPSWRQAIPESKSHEITSREDWDQEDKVRTKERSINTPILCNVQGKIKSEKRDLR